MKTTTAIGLAMSLTMLALLILAAMLRPSALTCADGTASRTCSTIHAGCCSSHGGVRR